MVLYINGRRAYYGILRIFRRDSLLRCSPVGTAMLDAVLEMRCVGNGLKVSHRHAAHPGRSDVLCRSRVTCRLLTIRGFRVCDSPALPVYLAGPLPCLDSASTRLPRGVRLDYL